MVEITNEQLMVKLVEIEQRIKNIEETIDKLKEVLPMFGIKI